MNVTSYAGSIASFSAVVTLVLSIAGPFERPAAAQTQLNVYTATASDDLRKYRERIKKALPDIEINWTRDSTGTLTAKLLAEKDNPQADVIFILASTSILALDRQNILLPYEPKRFDELNAKFKDTRNDPPHFIGSMAILSTVCFNTVEAENKKLPTPVSWKDLLNPAYKGQIVMPNPNSSGTGFMTIAGLMAAWGEEATWAYLDALHENIAVYVHSGSQPCVMSATGEFPVGISFAFRGAREKAKGAPIEVISPTEGLGWEMLASGIVKGTKNLDAAKRFMDWVASEDAAQLVNEDYAVIARPEIAKPVEFYPANPVEKMIDLDVFWSSENYERITTEWTRRYDTKSATK